MSDRRTLALDCLAQALDESGASAADLGSAEALARTLSCHGMGPCVVPRLKKLLKEAGLFSKGLPGPADTDHLLDWTLWDYLKCVTWRGGGDGRHRRPAKFARR